ncbi:Subunit of mitochondrial NADH:ubiquinone oxidoreductase (complex I) [Komagataella phaffii CBS 7435]|uniref:NADH dehydrogenase [ubiquinone] 1 alpha subcomplex subunit 13 n=3 Tax=Komagataella TaxID=460517 RepID=C4R327_KOMPG|nr:Hypothetical protein PAS_chr2-2_0035 [Komagataella phaffii GS115]AOA61870.1 GQ67_01322T0 [Komagataella phaffii]KAI0462338.1 hypothetical protein LJB42_004428 [Komagataella kurtzmanii]CAH2447538.1 Subunit of mitochondrial NADHubiquinone oxidoreductase (complex I) [Komagataella phaffii CBS 7435]CBI83565.1 NB6M (B16.6) subunit of mitochondrial NADH:ubiquinone oxidoreductase (complex I) [Komagataella pastoris]AOA67577.1 GQ68_00068T0 [Komagataella phaffii GS115]
MATQDLPPISGYAPIQWKRNLPSRGFRPVIWFLGLCTATGYGFYQISLANREKIELKREKLWARAHLMPLLQAEQDRNVVRRTFAYYKREGEIMKDVPWWEVKSTYSNKDIFHPPQTVLFGKHIDRDSGLMYANSRNRFGPDEEETK